MRRVCGRFGLDEFASDLEAQGNRLRENGKVSTQLEFYFSS